MDKPVYIIGGGTSLKGFDFTKLKDKTTIAVNKSYSYVPNLDYFVTIDFTFLAKMKSRNISFSKATKIFIANFTKPYLQEIEGKIIDTRFQLVYDLKYFNMIIKSYKDKGIGIAFNDFRNGNNSGFCALQFAVLMGFNPIYLLGMDLVVSHDTHFHGGYNESNESFQKKLDGYFEFWKQGLEELKIKAPTTEVISCSKISKLNGIINYESNIYKNLHI